jgi:hypothetical protein
MTMAVAKTGATQAVVVSLGENSDRMQWQQLLQQQRHRQQQQQQ